MLDGRNDVRVFADERVRTRRPVNAVLVPVLAAVCKCIRMRE